MHREREHKKTCSKMKQTERMTPQLKVGCFCLVCAIIKVLKAPYTLFSLHGAQIFNNRLSMRAASNKNCTPLHIKLNTFYWISEKASERERKKGLSNCIKGGKTKLPVALLHGSYEAFPCILFWLKAIFSVQ